MRVLLLLLPLAGAFAPAPLKFRSASSSLFFFGGGSGAKDLDEEVRACVFGFGVIEQLAVLAAVFFRQLCTCLLLLRSSIR